MIKCLGVWGLSFRVREGSKACLSLQSPEGTEQQTANPAEDNTATRQLPIVSIVVPYFG